MDAAKGFGGKYGVQTDRRDKVRRVSVGRIVFLVMETKMVDEIKEVIADC